MPSNPSLRERCEKAAEKIMDRINAHRDFTPGFADIIEAVAREFARERVKDLLELGNVRDGSGDIEIRFDHYVLDEVDEPGRWKTPEEAEAALDRLVEAVVPNE